MLTKCIAGPLIKETLLCGVLGFHSHDFADSLCTRRKLVGINIGRSKSDFPGFSANTVHVAQTNKSAYSSI